MLLLPMLPGRKTFFLVLVSTVFAARAVHGESRAEKERQARTACLAGEYAEGVRLLSQLFVATMDPTFIYNQGRCFEQNLRYEDAIGRFQEYLRVAKTDSKARRAEAEEHIEDCKALLAGGRTPSIPGDPGATSPSISTPPAPPTAGAPPAASAPESKPAMVNVRCNREGALVRLDGKEAGKTPLGVPMSVAEGEHELVLEYQGESRSSRLAVKAGEPRLVEVLFEAEPVAPVAVSPAVQRSSSPPPRKWYRSPWVWTAAGAVAAGIATALILVYGQSDRYPSPDMGTRSIGD
jgi:hypothetical protein